MFEFDSAPRRSRAFYLIGLLYLVSTYVLVLLIEKVSTRFGKAVAALIPGTILVVVSGVLYAIANRKRNRLLGCPGLVERVEAVRRFSDEEEPGETALALRKLSIRFRPKNGETFHIESVGYYFHRVGDSIEMLYEPGQPEMAMTREAWNDEFYAEYRLYGCMAMLYLLGGCFVLWLFF